ncbi:hypothetical protein EVAR_54691_1 [Eumeta japonica]|uniref:Uncharacterized protein n=1 Tax=Eumeta variegata TaxID=151549 RepID=A0A4C1X578_EUMVA|nr:hypothetical protein EVAR_54691_1 [Eumeta japonica]
MCVSHECTASWRVILCYTSNSDQHMEQIDDQWIFNSGRRFIVESLARNPVTVAVSRHSTPRSTTVRDTDVTPRHRHGWIRPVDAYTQRFDASHDLGQTTTHG